MKLQIDFQDMALQRHLLLLLISFCFSPNWADLTDDEYHLTILHTGSFTSKFQQFDVVGEDCSDDEASRGDCLGGMARLGTAINNARVMSDDNVLLLDGGDQFLGEWFNFYKGNVSAYFMNKLKYDAMVSLH